MAANNIDKVSQRPKTQNNVRPERGDSEQQEASPGEQVTRLWQPPHKDQKPESRQEYPHS